MNCGITDFVFNLLKVNISSFQFVQLVDLGVDVCGHAFGPDYYAFFGSDDGQRFALSHQLQNKLLKFMDRKFSYK